MSGKQRQEKYREVKEMMGAVVSIDVCVNRQNKDLIEDAYKEVWARMEDIAWRMNVFDERSDVTRLNEAQSATVQIKPDTYQVLKDSIHYSHLTQGAFDITVWPLIRLWKEGEKKNIIPSPEALAAVMAVMGAQQIQLLDNHTVRLLHPDTRIDLGGIAAGYAVDEAVAIFRRHGIVNLFIDAGGDIYAGGVNCEGNPWRVGVSDPRDRSKIINVLGLSNMAVTTSGNYERYYEIQNKRWSHIMNPSTGYPQEEVVSATVIAPTTIAADALATALCVMGHPGGTDLMNGLGEKNASLIILKDGKDDLVLFPSEKYSSYELKL